MDHYPKLLQSNGQMSGSIVDISIAFIMKFDDVVDDDDDDDDDVDADDVDDSNRDNTAVDILYTSVVVETITETLSK